MHKDSNEACLIVDVHMGRESPHADHSCRVVLWPGSWNTGRYLRPTRMRRVVSCIMRQLAPYVGERVIIDIILRDGDGRLLRVEHRMPPTRPDEHDLA